MKRRLFYLIIAFGLAAIVIYFLLDVYFLSELGFRHYNTSRLKDWFAVSIIVFETIYALKTVKTINTILFPFALVGRSFTIMHWPFGRLLFLGSFLTILINLFINAVKSDKNRLEKMVILAFPMSRLIMTTTILFHFPRIWWLFDLVIIGLTALFLFVRIAKGKLDLN